MSSNDDKKHFKIRFWITIIFLLILLGMGLYHDNSTTPYHNKQGMIMERHSCLGPTYLLLLSFIGVPSTFIGLIVDIIILTLLKKINRNKFITNLFLIFGFIIGVIILSKIIY